MTGQTAFDPPRYLWCQVESPQGHSPHSAGRYDPQTTSL